MIKKIFKTLFALPFISLGFKFFRGLMGLVKKLIKAGFALLGIAFVISLISKVTGRADKETSEI